MAAASNIAQDDGQSTTHTSPAEPPFLHRNWITAVNSVQALGGKLSTPAATVGDRLGGEDDHYSRAAKRRRFADPSPVTEPLTIGCSRHCFLDPPSERQRAMRFDVLDIVHKDLLDAKTDGALNGVAGKTSVTSRARCKISIYAEQGGAQRLLHIDNQVCRIKLVNPPGPGPALRARVQLPQAFIVHEGQLLVETESEKWDLADLSTIVVELEIIGDGSWPPVSFHLPPLNGSKDKSRQRHSPRTWVLVAKIQDPCGRPHHRIPLGLRTDPLLQPEQTDFLVDVDLRWSTGFSERMMPSRLEEDQDALDADFGTPDPTDEAASPQSGVLTNGDATDGHANGVNGVPDDDEEEVDGELTPGRSLRTRESKVYNLKVLSDKAHRKTRRKPRKQDKWDKVGDGSEIVYKVANGRVAVNGLVCPVCAVEAQSTVQLRAHFQTCHPTYSFSLEQSAGRSGHAITISYVGDAPGSLLRKSSYQLGRVTKPMDWEKFLDGDESWVTSRYGPDDETAMAIRPAEQSQPVVREPILVPITRLPLFDPLSKARLEPGTEIRPMVADKRWLVHKHREVIKDYSDVPASEQEYIEQWDAFIIPQHLSSAAYFPRAFLAFVEERAPWIVERLSRAEEFGKHLATLILRDLIEDADMKEALEHIDNARKQQGQDQTLQSKPAVPSPKRTAYRSVKGCGECGLPVLGPSMLLCSNKRCGKRLYHDECVKAEAIIPVDCYDWRCNRCAADPDVRP